MRIHLAGIYNSLNDNNRINCVKMQLAQPVSGTNEMSSYEKEIRRGISFEHIALYERTHCRICARKKKMPQEHCICREYISTSGEMY